jgi:hypothetical protein
MKLASLAMATAFALGIACCLNPDITHRGSFLTFFLCDAAATSLLIGIGFAWRTRVVLSGPKSVVRWGMLGLAAVYLGEQRRRANHILSLVDAGKIDLKSLLRYYRRLADEPERLPWGAGYNIELSGVDFEGVFVPASGGLRLAYIAPMDRRSPVAAHRRSM